MYGSYVEIMAVLNNQSVLRADNGASITSNDSNVQAGICNGNHTNNTKAATLFNNETDFILGAEFCEEKGPVSMFTIPNGVRTDIDLDSYVMQVFSSDHQNLLNGTFKMSKDVQVLMSDYQNTHSYIHYFTLHDINARGYVRLMCLAYISTDQKKIMDNFSSLKTSFTEVATVLKHANKSIFQNELENYCHNYLNDMKPNSSDNKEKLFIKELQYIFNLVSSLPVDFRLNDILSFVEEYALTLFHWERLYSLWPCRTSLTSPANCNNMSMAGQKMKNIFELCMWGSILGFCLLLRIQRHFKRDVIILMMEEEDDKMQNPDFGLLAINDHILMNMIPKKSQPCCEDQLTSSVSDQLKLWFKDFFLKAFYSSELKATFASAIECKPLKYKCLAPMVQTDAMNQAFQKCVTCRKKRLSSQNFLIIPNLEAGTQKKNSILRTTENFTPELAGYGIADIFRMHPCLHHLLYALFTGRLVIIVGTNSYQDIVRSVVQALDLFIPEKSRYEAVLPWSPKPLSLGELVKYKLIGMNARAFIDLSSGVRDYTAVLDVTNQEYTGPIYEGNVLSHIPQLSNCRLNDSFLTLHVFNLLLILINKVLIYYHYETYESSMECDTNVGLSQSLEYEYRDALQIHDHDAKIAKHFVSLLKHKQIQAIQMRNGEEYSFAPCLQLF